MQDSNIRGGENMCSVVILRSLTPFPHLTPLHKFYSTTFKVII